MLLFSSTAYAQEVIVSGECVGVKLYTNGLIITDTSTVTEKDGTELNLALGYDIKKGDIITKINGMQAVSNEMFSDILFNSAGEITITISRDNKERDITLLPADTENGPRLGLWLRDSTAGLGTITYYTDNKFAALGHGICDVDTGCIMPVGKGVIQGCSDTVITKGQNGSPGAIIGSINGAKLGDITLNTDHGLFGTIKNIPQGKKAETADKSEIRTGKAAILANVDGSGVKEYNIKIQRISPSPSHTKDMVIEITDKELLSKTGGIVQGMSGAPIIQNNKLVGAVTHVFINDPTKGYGIFIENMLAE